MKLRSENPDCVHECIDTGYIIDDSCNSAQSESGQRTASYKVINTPHTAYGWSADVCAQTTCPVFVVASNVTVVGFAASPKARVHVGCT